MRLEVLHVPDCPNRAVLDLRLHETLADRPDVAIEYHVVRDQADAAQHGMTGSPTLLVDGVDPFAVPGQAPNLSCRLYLDEHGAVSGAPSVQQLRAALAGVTP